MYWPLTPLLDCQQTCRAPHSWIGPNERMIALEPGSSLWGLSILAARVLGSKDLTRSGSTSLSCSVHVVSMLALIPGLSVARFISAVVSRSRIRMFSISIWEWGQSQTGVTFKSSAKSRGYLHILWIGYMV